MIFVDTLYLTSRSYHSKDEIYKHIKRIIHMGCLSSCGEAFTFEIHLLSETIEYVKSEATLFPRWNSKEKQSYSNLQYVKDAIKKLSPNSTISVEPTCFRDERTQKDFGHARVEYGHIISVNVPKSQSQAIYADFSRIGTPFKNKLLNNHTDLLKQIVQYNSDHIINRKPRAYSFAPNVINPSLMNGYANYFFVSPSGMENTYNDESTVIPIQFCNFRMTKLRSIYECYGFAMAIVEIYRPLWEKYGKLMITYELGERYGEEGILVRFGVRKNEHGLKEW